MDNTLVSFSSVDEKNIDGSPPQNSKIYTPISVTRDIQNWKILALHKVLFTPKEIIIWEVDSMKAN